MVNGVATFSGLTLTKAGTAYTLTLTAGSLPTATTAAFNVTPAAAALLVFSGMPTSPVAAGTAFTFTVTADDAYGNVATGYTGTVKFTGTDPGATLPAAYTFTSANAGTHVFSATMETAGTQTITAADTVTSSINGEGERDRVLRPPATATFVEADTTTKGNWIGAYGTQGYNVVGYTASDPSYPSYAVVTPAGQTTYTWASEHHRHPRPAEPRQHPRQRLAAAWYSATSFTLDVNLTDGQAHDIALYLLDWDSGGRPRQSRSPTPPPAPCSTPDRLVVRRRRLPAVGVSGHVCSPSPAAGANAVLTGLFFDPTSSSDPAATATFLKAGHHDLGELGGDLRRPGLRRRRLHRRTPLSLVRRRLPRRPDDLHLVLRAPPTPAPCRTRPAPRQPRRRRLVLRHAASPSTSTSPTARRTTSRSTSSTGTARPRRDRSRSPTPPPAPCSTPRRSRRSAAGLPAVGGQRRRA